MRDSKLHFLGAAVHLNVGKQQFTKLDKKYLVL